MVSRQLIVEIWNGNPYVKLAAGETLNQEGSGRHAEKHIVGLPHVGPLNSFGLRSAQRLGEKRTLGGAGENQSHGGNNVSCDGQRVNFRAVNTL